MKMRVYLIVYILQLVSVPSNPIDVSFGKQSFRKVIFFGLRCRNHVLKYLAALKKLSISKV